MFKVSVQGDTIIIPHNKIFVQKDEFKFKWDESVQWFGGASNILLM